jgi:acyl-coenzyme A synthetase/AMP-(fatty) acid ligase
MAAVNTVAAPERFNASVLLDRNLDAGRAGKPAVHAADRSLTYAELLAGACRAGHLLRALGVAREERVLLVLDDTSAFPRVFLGAMRLGAVPVPVSPLTARTTSATSSTTATRAWSWPTPAACRCWARRSTAAT